MGVRKGQDEGWVGLGVYEYLDGCQLDSVYSSNRAAASNTQLTRFSQQDSKSRCKERRLSIMPTPSGHVRINQDLQYRSKSYKHGNTKEISKGQGIHQEAPPASS
ncbi:hypothetical protein K491DRAFT_624834 [Lophiostoma macrostomum CBS 122681]|uniref:Uncharacterized protein n=1 Tax=Lophiostoma macrostomum CBS 122681 TaxID=1314788 RepID=A0A6A6THM8_9PLEO|nr:hypothetical protein K491DRAFT_624834 [Lophiostoma macrostomum CBS 122681]